MPHMLGDLFDDIDVDELLGVEPDAPEPQPRDYNSRRHKVVCKYWLKDLCKRGDDCDFLHKLDHSRMPECHMFVTMGECNNKDCILQHISPEQKTTDCPWYARGFCKHGPRCRHRHTRKEPCPRYLAGVCPDGPLCTFGHPKYELPPIPRDGGVGPSMPAGMVPRGDLASVTCACCAAFRTDPPIAWTFESALRRPCNTRQQPWHARLSLWWQVLPMWTAGALCKSLHERQDPQGGCPVRDRRHGLVRSSELYWPGSIVRTLLVLAERYTLPSTEAWK